MSRYPPSFEPGMLLLEFVEIQHQLIDGLFHVHVSDASPNLIFFRKDLSLLFRHSQGTFDFMSKGEEERIRTEY
jgi:hypothetical protein